MAIEETKKRIRASRERQDVQRDPWVAPCLVQLKTMMKACAAIGSQLKTAGGACRAPHDQRCESL